MKSLRILFLGLFLTVSLSSHSQTGKEPKKSSFCRICVGSRVFANYIYKTQIDAGLDYLVYTAGYSNNRGLRKIGKPVGAHRLFFRLGVEYNFKFPIVALKVGVAYQPFKNLYTPKPKLEYDATNKFSNFLLKTLGSLNAEVNFLPYFKKEFRSFAIRPEVGLAIPFLYRFERGKILLKPLSVKVNYGYNFYKNNVVPPSMNVHFFSVGLNWKLDLGRY